MPLIPYLTNRNKQENDFYCYKRYHSKICLSDRSSAQQCCSITSETRLNARNQRKRHYSHINTYSGKILHVVFYIGHHLAQVSYRKLALAIALIARWITFTHRVALLVLYCLKYLVFQKAPAMCAAMSLFFMYLVKTPNISRSSRCSVSQLSQRASKHKRVLSINNNIEP